MPWKLNPEQKNLLVWIAVILGAIIVYQFSGMVEQGHQIW